MALFQVEIRRLGTAGSFRVQVLASPAGEASEIVSLDVETILGQLDQVQDAVLTSSLQTRRVIDETEQRLRRVGQELFIALLGTGEVAGRYRASAALAAANEEPLRVAVRIAEPALASLPWETMYDSSLDTYVCRHEQLVRQLPVPRAMAPVQLRPPLRILALASSPSDLPELDVEKEMDQLTRALAPLIDAGQVFLHWAEKATWEHLHRLLLSRSWHVVHFVGHGDFSPERETGRLALVARDSGRRHLVEAHQFVNLLRQCQPMPRLVLLNSCSGAANGRTDLFAGVAAALIQAGVMAVTAMQFEITDRAAIEFAHGFYAALAYGRDVDTAVSSGRAAVVGISSRTLEWATPVLYLRGDQAQLFTIKPGDEDDAAGPQEVAPPGARQGPAGTRTGDQSAETPRPHREPDSAPRTPTHEEPQNYVTPLVRRLAMEYELDVSEIEGTGVGGRVTKQDIFAAVRRRGRTAGTTD